VFYDVTTPLGQTSCDTGDEVTEHIAAYMETEGATLNQVAVIRVPETGNKSAMGGPLSPGYFWTPPE
jgi:hypothetical protein